MLAGLPIHTAPIDAQGFSLSDSMTVYFSPRVCMTTGPEAMRSGVLLVRQDIDDDQTDERDAVKGYAESINEECCDLDGIRATEASTVAELIRCRFAHFACHGKATPARPFESSLHLNDGDSLSTETISKLSLAGLELVVLAACETGIPGYQVPDEQIGLPSAFLHAGASGVVATLWKVPHDETTSLMRTFYGLIAKDTDAGSALRQAQAASSLDLDSTEASGSHGSWSQRPWNRRHPFYWAGFKYVGRPPVRICEAASVQ